MGRGCSPLLMRRGIFALAVGGRVGRSLGASREFHSSELQGVACFACADWCCGVGGWGFGVGVGAFGVGGAVGEGGALTGSVSTVDVDLLVRMALQLGALQKPEELRGLCELVGELRPLRVLEVGTQMGGTLMCWCRLSSPVAQIISVDLPDGPYGGGYPLERVPVFRSFVQGKQRLTLIRADSHLPVTLQKVELELAGLDLDFLFIDGDHSYEGCMNDFEMYGPLVRKGGLIAFHDIAEHGPEMACHVREVWEDVKGEYEHLEFTRDSDPNWGGVGVLRIG